MIRRLRIGFIALSMSTLFILLALIILAVNLLNYRTVIQESDMVLSVLSQNKGAFPEHDKKHPDKHLPPNMSPETPYESRFFSVLLSESGEILSTETNKITVIDAREAISYGTEAFESQKTKGFIGEYRYIKTTEGNTVRITFLDCGRKLHSFRTFLSMSLLISLCGFLLVFIIFTFCAGRIIRPISESYEKQKRFITDAGHELKTPLTIINANVDVLEMEFGENECLQDIQHQTRRLVAMTNELVLLSRMEEPRNNLSKIEFSVSETVAEAAIPFRILAQQQEKHFICELQPGLTMRGDQNAILQLVSILMDNAIKYSPTGGTVSIQLSKHGRMLHLVVCNSASYTITKEILSHVFDRFYRTDPSRNSESGGYGIGLSIAQAIVNAHDGKIQATTPDEQSFQISVVLPS